MSRDVPSRTPSVGRLAAIALAALLFAACATPQALPPDATLSRETPEDTYHYFKTMAQSNQWAGEWAVFSPNFKRMVNQQAGRNVDLGDYGMARKTMASNSTSEMKMLLGSTYQGTEFLGPDRARITISAGGRSISPTMVRMTKWELRIRGETDPASGTVARPGDAIQVNANGSITVSVQADPGVAAALRTIPRENIEGFAIKSEWYVDDFGGLGGALGSAPPQNSQPTGQPAPQPAIGYGSPDQ